MADNFSSEENPEVLRNLLSSGNSSEEDRDVLNDIINDAPVVRRRRSSSNSSQESPEVLASLVNDSNSSQESPEVLASLNRSSVNRLPSANTDFFGNVNPTVNNLPTNFRRDTPVSAPVNPFPSVIRATTAAEKRGDRFRGFFGDPIGAFTSAGGEALQFFGTGGRAPSGRTREFLERGTPVEQTAALAGSVGLFAIPRGLGAVGRGEAALLDSATARFAGFGGRALRLGGGLSIAGLETSLLVGGASSSLSRSAPDRLQPFLNDDIAFSAARSAEVSSESNFIRRALGGVNPNLNTRNLDNFRIAARQNLASRGITGSEADTRVDALLFRRSNIDAPSQLLGTLNAGRASEIFGRVSVREAAGRVPDLFTGSFGRRSANVGRRIAPAGIIETFAERSGDRSLVSDNLPMFSLSGRSRVGDDLASGALGAASAGILGGIVGGGFTAPVGRAGRASRGVGRTANIIGNVADVSEPFTDLLAGSVATGPSRVIVPTPVSGLGGFTPALESPAPVVSNAIPVSIDIGGTMFSGGLGSSSPVRPNSFTPSSVSPVLTPIPVNPFVPTPVNPSPRRVPPVPTIADIFTPVPPVPTPVTPVPTPVTPVPSLINPLVPVDTPVTSFASVPVTSFLGRFPPPIPFDLNLGGGSGRGGRNRPTVFVDELSAGLNFFDRATSVPTPFAGLGAAPKRASAGKKSKKSGKRKTTSTGFINLGDGLFNFGRRGVRFV